MTEILLYALIGTVAGFFSGMLGIGGGIIMVPPMIWIFVHFLGVDATYVAHIAVATSASIIVFTSIGSALSHSREKNVQWQYVRLFSVTAVIGCLTATAVAPYISSEVLKVLLMLLLFYNSHKLLLEKKKSSTADASNASQPVQSAAAPHSANIPKPILSIIATCVSFCSTLVGIGGGLFNVPLLYRVGVAMKHAIGSSAVINISISSMATFGYLLTSTPAVTISDAMLGMIYTKATLCIAAFSIITSYIGAKVASRLPSKHLVKLFGCITLLFALQLLYLLVFGYGDGQGR